MHFEYRLVQEPLVPMSPYLKQNSNYDLKLNTTRIIKVTLLILVNPLLYKNITYVRFLSRFFITSSIHAVVFSSEAFLSLSRSAGVQSAHCKVEHQTERVAWCSNLEWPNYTHHHSLVEELSDLFIQELSFQKPKRLYIKL